MAELIPFPDVEEASQEDKVLSDVVEADPVDTRIYFRVTVTLSTVEVCIGRTRGLPSPKAYILAGLTLERLKVAMQEKFRGKPIPSTQALRLFASEFVSHYSSHFAVEEASQEDKVLSDVVVLWDPIG